MKKISMTSITPGTTKPLWPPFAAASAWGGKEDQLQPSLRRPGRRHQGSARRHLAGHLYGLCFGILRSGDPSA
jgi:hypothetical protein